MNATITFKVDWTIWMNVWNWYENVWILIVLMYYFPTEFLRNEKNRKWISFLKAIYAHKLVDLFCCCGFECKREDEEKEEKLNIQFIFRLSVPPHIWKQDIQKIQPVFSYSLLILHCQFQYVLFMLNTLQSNDFRLVVNSIYCRFCSISYGSLIMCSEVFNINFFHLWPCDFQISSVLVCHVLALSRGAGPQKSECFCGEILFQF